MMQDPLGTVDPLFLNIPRNNLQSPSPRSQYAAAVAVAAAPVAPGQWSNGSFVEKGIGMSFRNELLRHRYRSSDDQLEILGQFEFGYALLIRKSSDPLSTSLAISLSFIRGLAKYSGL